MIAAWVRNIGGSRHVARKQKTYLACDWPGCISEDASHYTASAGDPVEMEVAIDLCPAHAREPFDIVLGKRRGRGAGTSRQRMLAAPDPPPPEPAKKAPRKKVQ